MLFVSEVNGFRNKPSAQAITTHLTVTDIEVAKGVDVTSKVNEPDLLFLGEERGVTVREMSWRGAGEPLSC